MKFNYEIWCANGPVKRWQKQKWNDLNNVGNKAKGRILKHVSQVKQAHQIFQKQTFLTPWYTNVRMYVRGVGGGGRNNRSSENLACFVSLRHPFWDSPFCLITDMLIYWKILKKIYVIQEDLFFLHLNLMNSMTLKGGEITKTHYTMFPIKMKRSHLT